MLAYYLTGNNLCFIASYKTIPAATETLKESKLVAIGILKK
jgi:hypothetical protein